MPKAGELNYVRNMSEACIAHAVNKPFSDPGCGNYLIAIGTLRNLLPPPPARMLDLGCGTGWTSCMFAKMGYDVVGQDIAPDMISWANHCKARDHLSNVRFMANDYENMAFADEFDCAMFFDSLHHAEDEYRALEMVHRALKPGGVLVTREPGEGHSRHEHSIYAMEKFGVTEKDMPPDKIMSMARQIGFKKATVFPFPDYTVDLIHRYYAEDGNRESKKGFLAKLARFWKRWFQGDSRKGILANLEGSKRRGGIVCLVK